MNLTILNRSFEHPADGWYHIEPKGDHPNNAGKVVQVIDDAACQSIVSRFNQDAYAGGLSHGHEMLIDHEHFKHDADKETIAYGWLQCLENREDGIYGRIRWSATGQKAVDGGDYRFFSTEYDPADLQAVPGPNEGISNKSSTSPIARVRPLRLDGLTLTNDPNNKGAHPITNRESRRDARATFKGSPAVPGGRCSQASDRGRQESPGGRDAVTFAGAGASAAKQQQNNQVLNKMKNIATKLGLAAEASEDALLAEVTRLQNRVTELQPLGEENKMLKDRMAEIDAASVDSLLTAHGVKDAKVLNRMKPVLLGMAYAERQAFLDECLPASVTPGKVPVPAAATQQHKLHNRDTRPPGGGKQPEGNNTAAENTKATKIMNRARELKRQTPNLSDATAVIMAQRELENQ